MAESYQENTERPIRRRTLTHKAQENYEIEKNDLTNKLDSLWKIVESELNSLYTAPDDTDAINNAVSSLRAKYSAVQKHARDLNCFLIKAATNESEIDRSTYDEILTMYNDQIQKAIKEANAHITNIIETQSICSHSVRSKESRRSLDSSTSSSRLALKRAEAQSARVRLKYTEKETALQIEKSRLEAEPKRQPLIRLKRRHG